MNALFPTALIVDGLSLVVTSEDLREIFEQFGTIVWARVAMDRSREPLGFGYVVMEAEEDATKAIHALDGQTIAGRKLHIAHTSIPPLPRIA
jgi:RNA recognition motif-containing protein